MKQIFKSAAIITLSLLLGITALAQKPRTKPLKNSFRSVQNWKTYDLCSNSVRAALPVAPVEKVESSNFGETTFITKTNKVKSGTSLYMVACYDGLPLEAEKMTSDLKKVFFDAMMKDFARQMEEKISLIGIKMKVNLLPVRKGVVDGRAGHERDFTIGPSRGTAKLILYGNRGVWSLEFHTSPGGKTVFFNSLKILG